MSYCIIHDMSFDECGCDLEAIEIQAGVPTTSQRRQALKPLRCPPDAAESSLETAVYAGPKRCSGCNLRYENCTCDPASYASDMRDMDRNPYSPDEAKVAHYLVERTGIGGGNTPVEFLIISHRALGDTIVNLKARISELSATAIENGWCRDLVLKKLDEILKD